MRKIWFLMAWLLVLPAHAATGDSAISWLQRMQQALSQSHFQYSLIHLQMDHIRPLRYLHGVVDDHQVAYLEHLNGPLKNVVRVDDQVTYLEHEVKPYSVRSARISGFIPPAFGTGVEAFTPFYQLAMGGRDRIAGRTSQVIRIVSTDRFRYSYQLWLDVKSGLPLRIDTINADGQLLEQYLVIELVTFSEPPPILSELAGQVWPPVLASASATDAPQWRFGWLPQGFEVTHVDQHRLFGVNDPVQYLSLSDGLTEMSVYIGLAGQIEMPENLSTGSGLSLASARHGEVEVVAVGKLPVESLSNVANSIYPAKGEQ
ncbi:MULTISPECIES: MucB/RseB C-terminal domain-containing protein [Ferrimonas]|uniref:MucB/RseB C-terminal domain-containing protein n=1 Tax=Ferrimonas TaxID=44011 RepID=UPI001FE0B3D4|nr:MULTISPECIES: MucB/RseB C-terminal domain-containing protein [Ferrimonas]